MTRTSWSWFPRCWRSWCPWTNWRAFLKTTGRRYDVLFVKPKLSAWWIKRIKTLYWLVFTDIYKRIHNFCLQTWEILWKRGENSLSSVLIKVLSLLPLSRILRNSLTVWILIFGCTNGVYPNILAAALSRTLLPTLKLKNRPSCILFMTPQNNISLIPTLWWVSVLWNCLKAARGKLLTSFKAPQLLCYSA